MVREDVSPERSHKPILFLTIGVAVNTVVLLCLGWYSYGHFYGMAKKTERDVKAEQAHRAIIHLDEVLGMSVRMAAATGDCQWEQRYRKFEPELRAAIEQAAELATGTNGAAAPKRTDTSTGRLLKMERRVFDLIRQGRRTQAKALVFGDEYERLRWVRAAEATRFIHPRRRNLRLAELRGIIIHLNEVLTMSARMTAATGDLRWERRYRRSEPELDAAIKEAMALAPGTQGSQAAAATNAANIKLVEMENRAFDLVRQGRADEAKMVLFSKEYERQKGIYADGMARFTRGLADTCGKELERQENQALLGMVGVVMAVSLMLVGWFIVFRATRKWQASLTGKNRSLAAGAKELTELNQSLDRKVAERTRELKDSRTAALNMMEDVAALNENLRKEIAERKKAETELSASNHKLALMVNKLEQVNRELTDFVYVASHDLREPLRKISSFGSLLKDSLEGALDQDDRENLAYMIDGADRMTKMIEGLLAYSRLNTRDEPLETVDLNDAVEQLERLELAAMLEEAGGTIEVPQPLPKVKGSPSQLRQLLQNLIANSIKYRREGVAPQIVLGFRYLDDETVRIEVRDNGIGISQEHHDDIFKMFRRLHSRRKYRGTGIGLAICKKIVDRHGGQIGMESKPGEGSTFWFILQATEHVSARSEPVAVS